jgi:hypothetical protein
MKSTLLKALLISTLLTLLTGCTSSSDETETPKEDETTATIEEKLPQSGEIPIEYPVVSTTAEAGEYVLAPTIEPIDKAFKKGLHRGIFVFYKSKMIEPGEAESLVEDFLGGQNYIPNSLIIPLETGLEVTKGDIVLTWWQNGDLSAIKGIVLNANGTNTPTIQYLADFDEDKDKIEESSFTILTNKLTPGITIFLETETGYDNAMVINVSGNKVLALKDQLLIVEDAANVTVVPPTINTYVGDTITTSFLTNYTDVTVTEVDDKTGQVWGEYEWAGETRSDIFYFGEIK